MKKRNEAMKEKSFLRYYALSLILLLLTINFYHLYKCQSSISNQLIQRYIKVLTNNMENELNSLQTEIEYLIQRQDLKALLKTNKIDASILNRIYLFLDKNNHLIQRLELYDGLSRRTFKRENDGEYLFSNIESHTDYIPLLAFNNIINNDNGVFEITIPLKNHESTTTANLKIIIRLNDYLDNQLHKYNKGNNNWCFVIDHEGQIISAFLDDKKITAKKISLLNLNSLRMAMDNQKTGVINHKIQYEKKKYNLLSNYATLNAYGYDHGIFVSLYKENIHWSILLNFAGFIMVLAYLIIILLQRIRKNTFNLKRTKLKSHDFETISLNLLNDLHVPIVCYDDKNRIVIINNRAKKLFMIQSTEEVIREDIALLKNTVLSSVLTENSETDTAFSTVFVTLNEEKRTFIKAISEFKLNSQRLYLAIIDDITDLELHTKASQSELLAKSEYLSIISHEIKTPLTSITGYSELISSRNNDPDITFFNDNIKLACNKMIKVINNILELLSLNVGRPILEETFFNMNQMISEIKNEYPSNENVTVEINVPHTIPLLIGDYAKIKLLLTSLLDNSMKLTKKGIISLDILYSYQKEESAVISFLLRDTGIGIPTNQLEQIFEPFKQGDSSYSRDYNGIGIGLTIALKIAKIMKSEINVSSIVGKGSQFSFSLKLKKIKDSQ